MLIIQNIKLNYNPVRTICIDSNLLNLKRTEINLLSCGMIKLKKKKKI